MALNLNQTQGQAFGAAGPNHAPGLVPDPGATAHSPADLLGDDGAFHTALSVIQGGAVGQVLTSNGASSPATFQAPTAPTVQRFTSGTGNYTPTSVSVLWIRVRVTAGGGGGGGTGGTNGTGTLISRMSGGGGSGGGSLASTSVIPAGGSGGNGPFGGASGGGSQDSAPSAAAANTGGGGGGGVGNNGATQYGAGGGGGSGEYVEFYVSPPGTIAYIVGAAASGGTGTVQSGGAGAAGQIIVEEFYQ